jgi:protocatechuate 3,4-dioxygenase beta subunit
MRVPAALFALLLVAPAFAAGQTSQPAPSTQPGQRTPPRDALPRPGEQPPAGTAVLRGQVLSVDGTPLRRAQVRAMSAEGRGGGVSTTDPQGKFEIKELPAGRYTVSASKAGYVTMQFGQRRADQAGGGTILDVLDKQIVEKIQFALPRGAVITGRVLDEFGEPIAGANVSASRYRFLGGTRRMTSSGADNTDDQGNFRIYGLPPGDYFVSGTLRSQAAMMFMPAMSSTETEGYAPSYYPGTPNVAEAQRVTVKGGQELTGINFALTATRLARIRGRVTSSSGEPSAGVMVMMTASDPTNATAFMMSANAQTRGDGTFQLAGVAPGTYTITTRPMGNPMAGEAGHLRLTVGGEDIDNVLITMSAGAIARGVVRTDDGSPLPVRAQLIRVMAIPADPMMEPMMGGMPPTVNEDGSFEMSGLFNRRLIRAAFAEPNMDWALKAVYLRDQDVSDTPIEFVPGQNIDGLEIVFTRKITEVTGLVRDDKGQPILDSTVVIFPSDSSRWSFQSRYVRTARVDQEGRFKLRNLPPHDEYRIVAVRDLEEGRWSDPEFLESVRDAAARVSLGEAQTAVQDLKLTRVP